MGIASQSNWTRGIAAATRKGREGGVVLLTSGTSLSKPTAELLRKRQASVRRADFIGDANLVSKDVRRQVRLIVR
jgi:hypothetical protein